MMRDWQRKAVSVGLVKDDWKSRNVLSAMAGLGNILKTPGERKKNASKVFILINSLDAMT